MASISNIKKENANDQKLEKYRHRESHSLNSYNKRVLLDKLIESGCSEKGFDDTRKRLKKLKPGEIEEYMNSRAYDAQNNVHEECTLPIFNSLNTWAEYFKEIGLVDECKYELALAFKAISVIESHPDPSTTDGIDFCHLYSFLADVLQGNPTVPLNRPTRDFLEEIFEELQATATEATVDRERLKAAIEENENVITIVEDADEIPRTLDPLNTEI